MAKDPLLFSAGSESTEAFSFNAKLPRAQRAAERQAAKMVVEVSKETVSGFRALIRRAIREGIPPREAAKMILGALPAGSTATTPTGGVLGLTTKQNMAALNYRLELMELGHSPARVEALMAKYGKKKLRLRAQTIARTETMNALNAGTLEGWKQAQEKGLLGKDAQKEWLASGRPEMCAICEGLNGQKVPLNETFPGGYAKPTAHPGCKCSMGATP